MTDERSEQTPPAVESPYPGSHAMPRWNVDSLIDAPRFTAKKWFAMLGPGLLMGGAAIGGGEWLMGPAVTARYGGALMWLGSLSILGQVVYNIEISRYALYTGEPIFTGKFRTLPGPMFWLLMYLILDFGAVFPYLAANAATPVGAVWLGKIPDSTNPEHKQLLQGIAYAIFLACFIPLIFGGKIYNSLRALMTFKIFVVLGFLTVLGVFYSQPSTWTEIFTGFVKFGNVPVRQAEDKNGNGILDADEEDWDGDNHADIIEPDFKTVINTGGDAKKAPDAFDINGDGLADVFVPIDDEGNLLTNVSSKAGYDGKSGVMRWPDFDGDGQPDAVVHIDSKSASDGAIKLDVSLFPKDGGKRVAFIMIDSSGDGTRDLAFIDFDRDGTRDGDGIVNVFQSFWIGDGWPDIDLSMIPLLAAFAAIAGSGGLSNAPVSNYTRDQGWGMGHHVGAIPSVVGAQNLQLSHVGSVFVVDEESLPRWRRWYRHVVRDQVVIWLPACFLGLALPSMLSVEFLKRGTVADQWTAAGMTAEGVKQSVAAASGATAGHVFWFMTLFCGFMVLAPSMAASIDGFVRRWVDVFWTALPALRKWDPSQIRYVYFGVLCAFGIFGMIMLTIGKPLELIKISTNIMNFALGFSCWHTLVLNRVLLPREIRPGIFMNACLFLAGLFFWTLAVISALKNLGMI